ncbi:GGDEF domain-containing protein [Candidatus Microgenomates bacterium]|nr:GGDEF domain-containing protein [Candidatus Microgenomates bacterium]
MKTTNKTIEKSFLASRRMQGLATKLGTRVFSGRKAEDFSSMRPEDILTLFHQGKLKEKDAMFWLGVLAVSADERAKEHEALATTDELTQVYNRRAFIDNLSKELSRLRAKHLQIQKLLEEPMTLSLMMIDIDYFKKINDKYGHLAGDIALKNLASLLQKQARGTDTVFRYGGEEFAILLPDSTPAMAMTAAERINKIVAKTKFAIDRTGKKKISFTISIGVAHVEGQHLAKTVVTDMFIPKLIGRADEALYRAKNNGRNQVVLWRKK